ncbi:PPR repeat/Pentatricopeptide repeat domain/PPR repeat family, putative [Angomonas deanei]|uniref:PPR repeat/Pentatricopeptide repeat domain/PPR repeat family, putative n=1 Tax=Angomonas deanei TaxID=59799 RepID=A0A7G2CVC7_9TRYP|nr:PPR repeat/Pentatricopeptide repeat domain/PPR repeat family, putative [Angomonas deanei]
MLSKVDTLLSSIDSRLKQGDPDMDINAAHIRAVFRGYGAAGKGESIKHAWDVIKAHEISRDLRIFNELFKWYSLMGNVKNILELKEEMEGMKINADSITYTWIIRALGRYYPRHVIGLYEELQSRHVRPDIQLYTTLIGVLGDLRKFDEVESLWADMLKREEAGTLQLTPICFAVRIRINGKNVERALQLFEEAKKRNFHEHPHVQTSLLHTLASSKEGGEKKVEEFILTLSPWSTDIYNVLLNMYSKQQNKEQFNTTLEKMKSESVAMNDVTFGTLITAFSRWGDEVKMKEVIQLLKDHEGEVSPTFYSVLASSLQRMGDVEGVSEAWEDLVASKLFPDTDVYNQFLSLYSRQHNIKKMQDVLDSMMKQVPPNPVTATTVLDMLGKSGRVSEMESLFEDMKETPDTAPTSVTYHQLLNTYAKTGDILKMENVYEELRSKGHVENAVTYNILMDGYGRAKAFEQMEEVLQKRKQSGIPPDDLTYCVLLSTYGKGKMESEVKRVFAEVSTSDNAKLQTRRVLWSAIDAFCRCGRPGEVEVCVEMLKEKTPQKTLRLTDCNTLIPYYCRLSDMDKVEEMLGLIKTLEGEVSYHSLNAIARGYARLGRFDKAVETLHVIRDKNWAPDASTALSLSGSFLKAGLHEQARQIIEWRRQYAKAAGEVEQISAV